MMHSECLANCGFKLILDKFVFCVRRLDMNATIEKSQDSTVDRISVPRPIE